MIQMGLEEIVQLITQYKNDKNDLQVGETYVITLSNCNGITTELLDFMETLPVPIVFKLEGDIYNETPTLGELQYNYSISKMREIILALKKIKSVIPETMNEEEKFFFIYRILAESIEYKDNHVIDLDYSNFERAVSQYSNGLSISRSLYFPLVVGEGVCVGYALALKNVLNYNGINCEVVCGEADMSEGKYENHAWNIVEVGGKWYFTDLTNDAIIPSGAELFPYCLKVDEEFTKEHILDEDSECKIANYKFADKNYDLLRENRILQHIDKTYNIPKIVAQIKEHQKKDIRLPERVEDLSPSEIMKRLFGDDLKYFLNDYMPGNTILSGYRAEGVNKDEK